MTALIITAALVPVAILAAVFLEPRAESWCTRRRLDQAHATSPNVEAGTEPHQPRVMAGKSPVDEVKLRA